MTIVCLLTSSLLCIVRTLAGSEPGLPPSFAVPTQLCCCHAMMLRLDLTKSLEMDIITPGFMVRKLIKLCAKIILSGSRTMHPFPTKI